MRLRSNSSWPPLQLGLRGVRFMRYLPQFVQLYWRLLRDPRVSVWPKALLLLSVLYVLSPVDILPDVMPLLGQADDLVLVIVVCRLFMYMCPREVVQEHVRRIDAEA
ncbi:MAG: YkvA family protein [Candidatus Binatia bacterium]